MVYQLQLVKTLRHVSVMRNAVVLKPSLLFAMSNGFAKYPHWWVYLPEDLTPLTCQKVDVALCFYEAWQHEVAHGPWCTCWVTAGRSRVSLEQWRELERERKLEESAEAANDSAVADIDAETADIAESHTLEKPVNESDHNDEDTIDQMLRVGWEQVTIPAKPTIIEQPNSQPSFNPYLGDDTISKQSGGSPNH